METQPTPTTYKYKNVYAVSEYRENGRTRTRWTKIGVQFPTKDGGDKIVLEALPISWDGTSIVTQLPKEREPDEQAPGAGVDR